MGDEVCQAAKTSFVNHDDFTKKGSLAGMGASMKRGMVLVLSLWDDMLTKMNWLDSATPSKDGTRTAADPGVKRGPCTMTAGDPSTLRGQHPTANVLYTNIMVGEIGSTFTPEAQAKKAVPPPVTAPLPAAPVPGQPPVQPQPPLQPVQPIQPVQPLQPVQPVAPLQPVPPVALPPALPLPGAALAPAGSFCCYFSPDQNDYCGKCTSKATSGWNANDQHCQQANGRWCGATRLFDAGQGAAVAAATEGAQRQLPTVATVLAWPATVTMLATLGAVSFIRYRRARHISGAAVDGTVGHLMQENLAEAEQTDGVA